MSNLRRRTVIAFAFMALLIPSAWFTWTNRDLPRFGVLHDDGILFASAKSLAATGEYRIVSLPESPYQTKYPPLYPLYLSMVWRLSRDFPSNLELSALFSWILLVPCLALIWLYYRRNLFDERRVLLLTALCAINPYFILFSGNALTEVPFTCLLLAALITAERITLKHALLAGILAGCAYLCRTAGIALLIAMPAWYASRRAWRLAAIFAAGMAPFVIGWTWWAQAHRLHTDNLGLIYYTDYLRFQFINVDLRNVATVVWKNFKELLLGMSTLALPRVSDSFVLRLAAPMVAAGMCSGIVRLVTMGRLRAYAIFALVYSAILVVWHYPPNERFVFPLYPLLLAGLVTEIEFVGKAILNARFRGATPPRAARAVLGTLWGAAVVAGFALELYGTFIFLPRLAANERFRQSERRTAYQWMARNLAPSAGVLSSEDPTLFLYAGFKGNTLPLLPRDFYAGRTEAALQAYRDVVPYCRSRDLSYFYFAPDDVAVHWTEDGHMSEIERTLRENPDLTPVFQRAGGTIFQIRPIPSPR